MKLQVLFTCEHARNVIPGPYREVAKCAGPELQTHRGYDPGTLELGRQLARRFKAPLITADYSRLLIELNRSPWHPALWSEFSRGLPGAAKQALLDTYYHPYRESVIRAIQGLQKEGCVVLHIGVHSFTPVLGGETRRADIGLLYDPARPLEKSICRRWKEEIRNVAPEWRVRMNYPYRGAADGLTTHLRKEFSESSYAGVELEVNQALVLDDSSSWKQTRDKLVKSLAWIQNGGLQGGTMQLRPSN